MVMVVLAVAMVIVVSMRKCRWFLSEEEVVGLR
jgi:hypothetical protein